MRDLRKFGWQIDTNREDPTLEAHEHRFTSEGEPVWQEGKGSQPGNSVSTVQRRELLARDGHKCRSCGISTGETYPGTYHASQLDIARRPVLLPSGAVEVQHVIECSRCRVGGLNLTADLVGVLARIERLPLLERKMLAGWVERDARVFSEVEDIWAAYRSLPADSATRCATRCLTRHSRTGAVSPCRPRPCLVPFGCLRRSPQMFTDFGFPPDAERNRTLVEERLTELKEAGGVAETLRVEWRQGHRHVEVIDMPVDALYYNPGTHRIRAQRSFDAARDRLLGQDPWSPGGRTTCTTCCRRSPPSRTSAIPTSTRSRRACATTSRTRPA